MSCKFRVVSSDILIEVVRFILPLADNRILYNVYEIDYDIDKKQGSYYQVPLRRSFCLPAFTDDVEWRFFMKISKYFHIFAISFSIIRSDCNKLSYLIQ